MANYKRRKRRKGGVKGCCAMCASQCRHGGLRNKRIETRQEKRAGMRENDQRKEVDVKLAH